MKEYPDRLKIYNVVFDNITLEEAARKAKLMIQDYSWQYITGTNANLLRIARKNMEYRNAINEADMSLADGYGVICVSHILGIPLVERVSCMDLLDILLPEIYGIRIYILGGKPETVTRVKNIFESKYPNLILCGIHHGYFNNSEKIAREIAQCKPDLLLVCLGSPKQELWMAKYGKLTGAKLACGCGGWIDIISGRLKRAPKNWRKWNIEWAYRLIQEPWRFRRVCMSSFLLLIAMKDAITKTINDKIHGNDT